MRRGRMQNSGKSAHFMLHFAHKNLARLSWTINPTIYLSGVPCYQVRQIFGMMKNLLAFS